MDGADDEIKRHLFCKGCAALSRLLPHADLHAKADALAPQRLICLPVGMRIKGKVNLPRIVEVEMLREDDADAALLRVLQSILRPHLRVS